MGVVRVAHSESFPLTKMKEIHLSTKLECGREEGCLVSRVFHLIPTVRQRISSLESKERWDGSNMSRVICVVRSTMQCRWCVLNSGCQWDHVKSGIFILEQPIWGVNPSAKRREFTIRSLFMAALSVQSGFSRATPSACTCQNPTDYC